MKQPPPPATSLECLQGRCVREGCDNLRLDMALSGQTDDGECVLWG